MYFRWFNFYYLFEYPKYLLSQIWNDINFYHRTIEVWLKAMPVNLLCSIKPNIRVIVSISMGC